MLSAWNGILVGRLSNQYSSCSSELMPVCSAPFDFLQISRLAAATPVLASLAPSVALTQLELGKSCTVAHVTQAVSGTGQQRLVLVGCNAFFRALLLWACRGTAGNIAGLQYT